MNCLRLLSILALLVAAFCTTASAQSVAPARQTWSADNGDGTYTNPLFYDEFSDPDVIRVGRDYYLTGTTMHSMPGLPVLHSTDLVNWEFVSYALDRLDLGPRYRLENGEQAYGQGIWAPSFRYHNGIFYIFSDVNGEKTQKFTATSPAGPWRREAMEGSYHDLSVLFDDDGMAFMVWGYQEIHLAQLNENMTGVVPGTEHVILQTGSGLGEGLHFYKIGSFYYILSAEYQDSMRMPAARARSLQGPWEIIRAISEHEDFGLMRGRSINGDPFLRNAHPPFNVRAPDLSSRDRMSLHQGSIVDTPDGEWWGISMYDANSIGRLSALSPVTWEDGWPMFGLPGNLGRSPRTWIKPHTGDVQAPHAPYQRSDDFSRPTLAPIWQWNHVPVDSDWSLSERAGYLHLRVGRAPGLLEARNTLTQRAIGPRSQPTVIVDAAGLRAGDRAGLALFTRPYAWLAIERTADSFAIVRHDEQTGAEMTHPVTSSRVWLRATADFMTETAQFSFSTDGAHFEHIGAPLALVHQLYTFQGVRYGLFAFNAGGGPRGFADFDSIELAEPAPYGRAPIPYGRNILLSSVMQHGDPTEGLLGAPLTIVDRGQGAVTLERDGRSLTVADNGQVSLARARGANAQRFQWSETPTGEIVLMSLRTNRYLRLEPQTYVLMADAAGPSPDPLDGVRFGWRLAE